MKEREQRQLMEGRRQAAATQQDEVMQRMVLQQEMHQKLLVQLQEDFAASQAKLLQV